MDSYDERAIGPQGPIFIVMNAGSGDKDAARETTVREILTAAGRPHRIWRITNGAQLAEATREAVALAKRQNGVVVAAGGDGTINSVAQAVLSAGCRFGVLPQGTFNYFSRAHGIPLDTAQATRLLLRGAVRPVQAGEVNGRIFLVNASLGLYPKLLENRELHKKRFGRTRLVALFSALVTLLTPTRLLSLTVEQGGEEVALQASTLLVENNPLQLEQVGLPGAEAVKKGQLALVVVSATGAVQLLGVMLRAAVGRLGEADQVATLPFASLTVRPRFLRRVKVAADGEVGWMTPPIVFRVAPRPLLLLLDPDRSPERSR